MPKTEVYSWRVTPYIMKKTLEQEARREGTSIAVILERITKDWISSRRDRDSDDDEQARLRASVNETIGSIAGKHLRRAELAKLAVRKRIASRHAR